MKKGAEQQRRPKRRSDTQEPDFDETKSGGAR
jgi:hypothetical protein